MEPQDKRKAGGARTARTETVSVRLDPKLRYLAELAARKQRRTLSSYIEWAVEKSLKDVVLREGERHDEDITVEDAAVTLWDVDESERFIRLATSYPELLNHEEQERWKMLLDSGLLGPAKLRNNNGSIWWNRATLEDVVYPVVRRHWSPLIEAHMNGGKAMREWIDSTRSEIDSGSVYNMSAQDTGFSASDDIPF